MDPLTFSPRLTFAVGAEISRRTGERYVVTALVEAENENFRARELATP